MITSSDAAVALLVLPVWTSMDSDDEAAQDPQTPAPGKHQIDREVGVYNNNYITMGFTYTGSEDFPHPQCVKCAQVLCNNCLKPSLKQRFLSSLNNN